MATVCQKFALAILLIVFSSSLFECLKVFDDDRPSVNSFRQRREANIAQRHQRSRSRSRRAVQSMHDSIECIRIGGAFDERLKEEAFKTFANEDHLNGDNKGNLQLAWTGQDYERIIVVTTEREMSSVYLSDESGRRFTNITTRVEPASDVPEITLLKHTTDSKIVYLVANKLSERKSVLHVSLDGAATFRKVPLEFKLRNTLIFHSTKVNQLLAFDENSRNLYLSSDTGLSWTKIKANVVSGKWGVGNSSDDIFVITDNSTDSFFFEMMTSSDNALERSRDFGRTWSLLYRHVYTFGLGDKFIYASIYQDLSTSYDRSLIVSTDAGSSWNLVQLPTIAPERFYSILDSNDGQIFLHVDQPGDTGRGTLYTSDATGIIFSESLENHLYPNYEDLTDFYRVQSMRGVYIASQLLSDDSIHTMITFDRGGEWQPIRRPEGVPCKNESKECYLQIHNLYSIKRGVPADVPLSVPNAVGLILVHGHVADALQTTPPDVFVTSDGGYTWRLALNGPHHYQIADHGSLLVAIPADTDTPEIVKFSTDEGRCWLSYNFTEKKIVYTGLLIEPGNRDMTVAIWGYTQDDRTWHTHVLNFTKILDKQCGDEDYVDWVPHQHNDEGCLLGRKETFRRIKANSWCYNGRAYEVTKKTETCKCTADDFDCDYGYKRSNDVCIKDDSAKLKEIDICQRGHEERIIPKGYHKIPGDRCSGGFLPPEAETVDLGVVCSSNPSLTPSPVSQESNDPDKISKMVQASNSRTKVILIALFALVSVVFGIIIVTYLAKKYNFIKPRPTFRYSSIRCEEDDPTAVSGAHALTSNSLFDDSSDDEEPMSIRQASPAKGPANGKKPSSNGHIPNGTAHVHRGGSSGDVPKTQTTAHFSNFEDDDELLKPF